MVSYLEPFTGSGAIFLHLLGAPAPYAPCGFAGNKRSVAPAFGRLFWPYSSKPDRVVLADVGPWRNVWEVFAAGKGVEIIATMKRWPIMPDRDLWGWLLARPLPTDPAEMAAFYIFLQARQAHHAPLWLRKGALRVASGSCGTESAPGHTHGNDDRWERVGGSGGVSEASQRPLRLTRAGRRKGQETDPFKPSDCGEEWRMARAPAFQRVPPTKKWGDALSRCTLIKRLEALCPLAWDRVTVLGDYREALGLAGPDDVVYADPPYRDAKVHYAAGYPEDLEEQLVQTARRGATVAVSEGRLLPRLLDAGWWSADVTPLFGSSRKPGSEQLMMSAAPAWTVPALAGGLQQNLFKEAK